MNKRIPRTGSNSTSQKRRISKAPTQASILLKCLPRTSWDRKAHGYKQQKKNNSNNRNSLKYKRKTRNSSVSKSTWCRAIRGTCQVGQALRTRSRARSSSTLARLRASLSITYATSHSSRRSPLRAPSTRLQAQQPVKAGHSSRSYTTTWAAERSPSYLSTWLATPSHLT